MTANVISLSAGVILSLLFSYVYGVNSWFDKFNGTHKRLIMLLLLVIVAAGGFGISCLGWAASFSISVTCDTAGAVGLFQQLMIAVIANQSTYLISPKK